MSYLRKRKLLSDPEPEAEAEPMAGVSNMADTMLVLAVGIMLALVMNWKVDLGGGQSVSGKSMNAADFTEVQDFEDVGEDDLTEYVTSEGLEEMGKVYIDPQTGKYYIMTRDATATDETNKDN